MTAPVKAREERLRAAYQANADPLLRYLRRLHRDEPESAEDLLQETMLRAWRHVDELPAGEEAVRRWLFTVARNLTIDAFRARLVRPAEVGQDDLNGYSVADDALDGVLSRQLVSGALRRLSPEHRAVLFHLYYADASANDAAAVLGVPSGTVRSRSFYALRLLREMLDRTAKC